MEVIMVQYKKNNAVKRTNTGMFLLVALLPALLVLLLAGCHPAEIGTGNGPNAAVPASVTYHLNGGTNGTAPVDSNTYSPGDVVTVKDAPTADAPTDAVDGFFGWSTSEDGFGRVYAAGAAFTFTKDTTLYALWNGDGSNATYPKLVSTADELKAIGATEHIALMADVTMTAPVTATPFKGTFDGRGHTVTLDINIPSGAPSQLGLFRVVGNETTHAVIKNVHVDGSITVGGSSTVSIGGIVAAGYDADVINCVSSVMISASLTKRLYAGGIVAMIYGTGTTITNCYVSGSISTNVPGGSDEHAAGGIVGDIGLTPYAITANIQKTVSLADITWTDYRSYAAATQGARRIVGFKGTTGALTGTIANNYALGTVTMTANSVTVNTQANNADFDGTAITLANAADETWWKGVWSDVWGGDNPTSDKPWIWDADAQQPKLYRVD